VNEAEIEGAMLAFGVSREEAQTQQYLGDGVYATHDGYQVWVRTWNGMVASQPIALDPLVLKNLQHYAVREGITNVPAA
jgi:hypothetical protein